MDESYNGWTNHNTWAANLWLTGNDEATYRGALTCKTVRSLRQYAEQRLCFSAKREIGSFNKVNWREILNGLQED